MHKSVHNACNSKYASYDSADMGQEIENVLTGLHEGDCDGGYLVIESQHVPVWIEIIFVLSSELEDMVGAAEYVFILGWHCCQIEVGL